MAEILIKASDTTNPDPVKDLRGCYKKGDVVVVNPDGWKWCKEELKKEKFYILRIPDKKPEELEALAKEHRITVGTRYISIVPYLGIYVDGTDPDAVLTECQKRYQKVEDELKKFGITPDYNVITMEEPVECVIANRRMKINVEDIENVLQEGIVELTSDKISITNKPQGTISTLAELTKN